jgi:hypothetical protein
MNWIMVLVSLVLGYFRMVIEGTPSETFQAVSHIWVGMMIGGLWSSRHKMCLTLLAALTGIEVIAAFNLLGIR